ncbi:MAG: signal peptidase I [Rhodospirillales bacterium]|nr:signal peptidase I [Rhodospirillales bacterium]
MFYLGRGRSGIIYLAIGIVLASLGLAAIFFGWIDIAPKLLLAIGIFAVQIVGVPHCYFVARRSFGERPKVWFSRWYSIIILALIFPNLLATTIRNFVVEPFNIPSGSMLPTLLVGDHIWVSRYAYGHSRNSLPFDLPLFQGRIFAKQPKRGDVIVYKRPPENQIDYIRRIVGLPSDTVQYKGGRLHINGTPVKREPTGKFEGLSRYVETLPNGRQHHILEMSDTSPADNTPVFVVPEGHYFGLGDNRDNAYDCRFQENPCIPFENIVGRFESVYWNSED